MSEFKVITYKRKKKTNFRKPKEPEQHQSTTCTISCDEIVKRIQPAKEDIAGSIFYQTFVRSLTQENVKLQNIDIVCYGLGQFSQCVTARYQFAFLLVLKDNFKGKVVVYDPKFSSHEVTVLKHLDCFVIDTNEEGKRQVNCDTIFFLPHCPKQLTNNLLWKNWSKTLRNCIIVGNSFEKIVEAHSDRFLKENLLYVFHASSFVTELKIDNSFKFSDIFNDLSIHLFLEQDIITLSNVVANLNKEPIYEIEDLEFVTYALQNSLSITN